MQARKWKGGNVKEPSRLGRPKELNPRNINITIRITNEEKKKLDKYCKDNNISVSDFFRKNLSKLK